MTMIIMTIITITIVANITKKFIIIIIELYKYHLRMMVIPQFLLLDVLVKIWLSAS